MKIAVNNSLDVVLKNIQSQHQPDLGPKVKILM